jgi:hypothetical protein
VTGGSSHACVISPRSGGCADICAVCIVLKFPPPLQHGLSPHTAPTHVRKQQLRFGKGVALVNDRRSALKAGTLLFIERKDRHEIKSTGRALLRTLNLYAPPGYTKGGEELPRAKP